MRPHVGGWRFLAARRTSLLLDRSQRRGRNQSEVLEHAHRHGILRRHLDIGTVSGRNGHEENSRSFEAGIIAHRIPDGALGLGLQLGRSVTAPERLAYEGRRLTPSRAGTRFHRQHHGRDLGQLVVVRTADPGADGQNDFRVKVADVIERQRDPVAQEERWGAIDVAHRGSEPRRRGGAGNPHRRQAKRGAGVGVGAAQGNNALGRRGHRRRPVAVRKAHGERAG